MKRSRAIIRLTSFPALGLWVANALFFLGHSPAFAQAPQPAVEQLQIEIRKRDALIEDLLRRVGNLEREVGKPTAAVGPGSAGARKPSSPRVARAAAGSERTTAAPPSGGEPSGRVAPPVQASPPAPGEFKVDEEAAERALERTLTAAGALLVPFGSVDVEPSFGYTRRENPNLVLFTNRRNEFTGLLNVRVGLPWESQITVGASYLGVGAQTVNDFVAPTQQVSNRFGSSFGDLTIALSKTLLHQSGWLPDLIAGITYEAPTGPQVTNGVALSGSGQSRLGFALTALKRQDPLAFVASVGYNKAFVHDDFNPGDQLNFTGGVFLATSPETSLSAVLQQSFGQAPILNGVTVTGANSVQSILVLGASSILGQGVLVNLQAGVGLTRDSPKYSVILSFPIRFAL
jgi:hypothetical protein